MYPRSPASSLLLFLLLLASAPVLGAPQTELRFQHLTMDDGLPDDNVIQILQDRLGFLWFGTTNGLVRYDGYGFVTYKIDSRDPHSLGGRSVEALFEDRDGNLWVGTRHGGLDRFDRDCDRFVHHRHDPDDPSTLSSDAVSAIVQTPDGTLWIGTGVPELSGSGAGLNRFDPETGTFTAFRHDPADPSTLSSDVVNSLAVDRRGAVWVATADAGLNRFDPATGTVERFRPDPADPATRAADGILCLLVDRDGRLWIASGDGVDRYDPETRSLTHFDSDPPARLTSDFVASLYEDPEGNVWLGTSRGIDRYDPRTDAFSHHRPDPEDPFGPSEGMWIPAIYEDRSGVLWIAVGGVGLHKLDPFGSRLRHYHHRLADPTSLSSPMVVSLTADRDGYLWAGTSKAGLNRLDPQTGAVTRYRHDPGRPESLGADRVYAVHQGRSGVLWVGTWESLDRFDPATGSFVHFAPELGTDQAFNVSAVHETAHDGVFVGTWGYGLWRFDPATETFEEMVHQDDKPSHGLVTAIVEDGDGTLWLGTEGAGLRRFDPRTGIVADYFSPASGLDLVTSLLFDRRGRLWVGTDNGGLHRFDRESGTSRAYAEREGLPNDTVHALVEDDEGRLWITTGRGLSGFDPEAERFRHYGKTEGVRLSWYARAALKGSDGALYLGGDNGLHCFFPQELEPSPYRPPVVFTHFRLFNQSVPIGADGPLARHVSVADVIRLSHRQNVLSFKFAALHFADPERNQYVYRMEPFDADWIEAGSEHWASYTNLPPGEYTFRVKAASGDGVWNEEGASIRVLIRPPWWRTWWAYGSYVLLAIAALIAFDRGQRIRVVRREREKSQRLEAQLRAEAAELQAMAAEAQARALEAENARKTRELEEARQLQLSMLPERVPEHPRYELAAAMRTATEVGGDYYDFDLAADGTLTVAIGDATGHGSTAGTMVTVAKSLFTFLSHESDLVRVLNESSLAIKRMQLRNLHMALALARVRNGTLVVANAGMPPLLIYRAGSGEVEEVYLEGMPLGTLTEYPYQTTSVALAERDVVVLMSDGLPETANPQGDLFGYERLSGVLREVAERSPQAVIHHFTRVAEKWADGRPQDDDMTFVVLKVKATDTH